MTPPSQYRQFRILYRDFLARIVDLELLSSDGDFRKGLVQFGALLAALNFVLAVHEVPRFALSKLAPSELSTAVASEIEFLIATTMAVSGLLMLLAWNSVLLDRRDCNILGTLPVRGRVIFLARVAGIATVIAASVVATNLFTGFAFPFFFVAAGGLSEALRALAAYWTSVALAGMFAATAVLAGQGVTALIVPPRLFYRFSALVQLTLFFLIVGIYFVRPFYPNPNAGWVPSFWFLDVFENLRQAKEWQPPGDLSVLAWWGLLVAGSLAAASFMRFYHRGFRRLAEQPVIAPALRGPRAGAVAEWLAARLSSAPLGHPLLPFIVRTMARSRQHRTILAAYYGVGLAFALAYGKDVLRGSYVSTLWDPFGLRPAVSWWEPSIPLLVPGFVILLFGVAGTRAVFVLPVDLAANWVFRLTEPFDPAEHLLAVRRALYLFSAIPVWAVSGILYFSLLPIAQAAQHMALMVLAGIIFVETALYRFHKIPFACSYLPGKANLHLRFAIYAPLFWLFADRGVAIEVWALQNPEFFGLLLLALGAAAQWARLRATRHIESTRAPLVFEDLPDGEIQALNLNSPSHFPIAAAEEPRPERDAGIDEEIEFHLRMATQERMQRGELLAAAQSAAIREFGNPTLVKEAARGIWTWAAWEQLVSDLRLGARILTHSPGLSVTAIALIAIGIGGNSIVYSMIHAVLAKPAPGVRADRLVTFAAAQGGKAGEPGHSYPNYVNYASQSRTMESIAAFGFGRFIVSDPESTMQLRGYFVTGNYFSTLGVTIVNGRAFTEDEMQGRAPLAAVIAHHIWEQQFHSDPNISGRHVVINGHAATIVGVAAAGFRGIQFAPNLEICVPFLRMSEGRLRPGDDMNRSDRWVGIIGRTYPDVPVAGAQAEFDAISRRLEATYPDSNRGLSVVLAPYTASAFGGWQQSPQARAAMTVLRLVSFLVLVVACANVGNLMLARAVARQRENAIRISIGASRWRVVRRLLAEGLVLSLAAACVAWLFTLAAASAANSLVPPLESGAQLELNVWPDRRVAVLSLLLALLTSVLSTLAGSIKVLRQDPLSCLKAGENAIGSGRSRAAQAFVVAQFALCVVLLTAGGLAFRSARTLNQENLSFKRENLMLASVNTSSATSNRSDHLALLERIQATLRMLPGVEAVSFAPQTPPDGQSATGVAVRIGGGEIVRTDLTFAGPDYLAALGVPILAGRDLVDRDTTARQPVAVINQNLANALWPRQSPLGRTVIVGAGDHSATIVGLAPNGAFNVARDGGGYGGLSQSERGNFMFLLEHDGPAKPGPMTFHVRHSSVEPATLTTGIRAAVHHVDQRIPVFSIQTMEQRWKSFTGPMRFVVGLFEVLAIGALIMSSIGLHAVIAFYTARRQREFALGMALGATPGQTIVAVLREGFVLTALGFAIGLPVTLALGQAGRGLLFGVTPTDPLTYSIVIVTLTIVSLVACLAPALRTVRIDPMRTLRQE